MMQKNITKILFLFLMILFLFTSSPIYGDDFNYEEENNNISSEIEATLTEETSSNISQNTLNLNSRSCVVIDRLSKYILYGKNEKNKVKMASTTKIMTAIVVIENTSLNKTVEVSKKAAGTGGSRLGLKTGDKITIRDLLYGLLLRSGNDAAICLAEDVAGSVSEFANLMNVKAQELGLSNTHFESPHGLDSPEHYTTAYELALLSDYALKNSTFLNMVGTKNYTITINGYPKTLSNTNELLGNLDGVYGIKTGFTNGANRCLVTACKRGNMDIICVVLGADTKNFRTKDSIKLIEYSFKNFKYFNIKNFVNQSVTDWKNSHPDFFSVEKGNSNTLELKVDSCIDETPIIPIKKNLIPNIEASLSVQSYFQAPLNQDDWIGNVKVSSQDTDIIEFDLLSNTSIRKNMILDYLFNFFKLYPNQLEQCLF